MVANHYILHCFGLVGSHGVGSLVQMQRRFSRGCCRGSGDRRRADPPQPLLEVAGHLICQASESQLQHGHDSRLSGPSANVFFDVRDCGKIVLLLGCHNDWHGTSPGLGLWRAAISLPPASPRHAVSPAPHTRSSSLRCVLCSGSWCLVPLPCRQGLQAWVLLPLLTLYNALRANWGTRSQALGGPS